MRRFLAVCSARGAGAQIVSLGAGLDTAFFRLAAEPSGSALPRLYVEVDFADVTARKAAAVARHAPLLRAVAGGRLSAADVAAVEAAAAAAAEGRGGGGGGGGGGESPALPAGVTLQLPGAGGGGASLSGSAYRLVTADLRDIASLSAALRGAGVDLAAPTLLLSECVLVYLEPQESCAIIAWAAQAFAASVFVTYEQIRPHDAFGQVMARNLAERGYSLRGLAAFPDLDAQRRRYAELGYDAVTVADMNDVYYRLLHPEAVARAERLELFDEVEEWHLMSAHYCIAVAVRGDVGAAPPRAADAAAAAAAAAAAPSPAAVAAAVVHAHEAAAAAAGGAHARSRGNSVSSSHDGESAGPPLRLLSARSAGSSASSSAPSSVSQLPPDLRAAADAIAEASGTSVESVELARDATAAAALTPSPPAAASPAAAPQSATASTAGSAATTAATLRTLHTHAGDVVLSSHAAGAVDFQGIAEAQEEMRAAGGMREATGLNLQLQRGRAASVEGRAAAADGAAAAAAAGGPVGSAWQAARERDAAAAARAHAYGLDALRARAAAGAVLSLRDVLFPPPPPPRA